MTFFKTSLAATTALGLSMAMAHAGDDNNAFLDQSGANHSASVTQSGDRNDAGNSGQKVMQAGMWNTLTIDQSGDDNDIGLGANADSASVGVTQTRNNNTSNPLNSTKSNTMTISQTSNGNAVGSAVQLSSGQGYNKLSVTQGGTGSNTVSSIYQQQSSSVTNIANITQDGTDNVLARVSQKANVGGSYNPNEITITMDGSDNGGGALTGAALASGALSSTLMQGRGGFDKGNEINIDVAGSGNQFGISQFGTDNEAVNISMADTNNQLGIYQDGSSNKVTLSAITGNENLFGIRQVGGSNMASLTANGNQNGGHFAFGANVAGTLANGPLGLTAGLIDQDGGNNSTTLTITGDGNVFATLQNNSSGTSLGNTINGTQNNTGSAGHQAAVAQMGDGNGATFNQIGSGNVAAISQ